MGDITDWHIEQMIDQMIDGTVEEAIEIANEGKGMATSKIVTLTAEYRFKTLKAVQISMGGKAPVWLPISQVHTIATDEDVYVDWNSIDEGTTYQWGVTAWIATRLFEVDDIDELAEMELDYVEIS